MTKEMTMKITMNDEMLTDEELDKVNGSVAPIIAAVGKYAVQYVIGKIVEIAVDEYTDKRIPNNAAPNFELIKPDFMPKL